MAHTQKHEPLAVIQSMVNAMHIEIGRAFSNIAKDKTTLAASTTRLTSTIPSAEKNFHFALDEIEMEIVRAKAVIQRDLDERRAARYARENPAPIPEPEPEPEPALEVIEEPAVAAQSTDDTEPLLIDQLNVPEQEALITPIPATSNLPTTPIPAANQPLQVPTPPNTNALDQPQASTKPIGLGITTEDIPPNNESAPDTADLADSSVDSLFDIPADDDNALDFSTMDFTTTDTQEATQAQTQVNDFDFGTSNTQDFTLDASSHKQLDDLFDTTGEADGGDTMDLDLGNMGMAEESAFDDLMWGDADDGIVGGGGEMEHGEFDDNFFGLDK